MPGSNADQSVGGSSKRAARDGVYPENPFEDETLFLGDEATAGSAKPQGSGADADTGAGGKHGAQIDGSDEPAGL